MWQDRVSTPEMIELENVTKRIVDEDGVLILETLQRIAPKYHDSLGKDSHKNFLSSSYRKVEYSVREKQKVKSLQERLAVSMGRLNTLISAAAVYVSRSSFSEIAAEDSRCEENLQNLIMPPCWPE